MVKGGHIALVSGGQFTLVLGGQFVWIFHPLGPIAGKIVAGHF